MSAMSVTAAALALGIASTPDVAKRTSREFVQTLDASPERILPLLTPDGERAWAHGWAPTILSKGPSTTIGTTFVTHHTDKRDTVWVLQTYDVANGHVAYVRVTPGSDVTEIDIQLQGSAEGKTKARVRYTCTALSELGTALVERMTPAHFEQVMKSWERALNHYLTTGELLAE